MTDKLVVEITGDLPDAGKFAILASAEDAAAALAVALAAKHPGVDLKVSVKAVRPGKKSPGAVVIPAAPPAPEVVASDASGDAADNAQARTHPRRHAAE